ncbi:MAG: hypothetical protein AB7E70_20225 [Hyphomicrobiaceae bacterium]
MKPESASEETTWEPEWGSYYGDDGVIVLCHGVNRYLIAHEPSANGIEEWMDNYTQQIHDLGAEVAALEARVQEAEAKAALADEAVPLLISQHDETGTTNPTWDVGDPALVWNCCGQWVKRGHHDGCKKGAWLARYDALKASANGEEANDGSHSST